MLRRRLLKGAISLLCAVAPFGLSAQSAATLHKECRMSVPYFLSRNTPDSLLIGGDKFIRSIDDAEFWEMERLIVERVLAGNIPDSLKEFRKIVIHTEAEPGQGILSQPHTIELWVLPDYLSIGTNSDWVRMPMGPVAAQIIADSLYCSLPTCWLVERINDVAEGHIEPFPFRPLRERNTRPIIFQDSNNAINVQYRAHGYHFGMFISGLKKDIVLSWHSDLQEYSNKVFIYGWHYPNGSRIQNLYVKHVNWYSDYSHGVRLIYRTIKIDGKEYDMRRVLEDPNLYLLLNRQERPMQRAAYRIDPAYYGE